MPDGLYTAGVVRQRGNADAFLERLIEEIDVTTALQQMADAGTYHGVYCPGCRTDVIPMPDGRCGWCDYQIMR